MAQPKLLQMICASAAVASVLAFAPSALAADKKGPLFLAVVRGGAATEAGGGTTLELAIPGSLYIGGSFDLGVNLNATYDNYSYYAPAAHGSYRISFGDYFELRPFFGARFPISMGTAEDARYAVIDHSSVAFMFAARASLIFNWFVVGAQFDLTPHWITWQDTVTGKSEETREMLMRASLVVGIALGGPRNKP